MATTTAATVSVEEYLRGTYEPDVEYVDGQLEERNAGEIEHCDVIAAIMDWFQRHAKEWQIRARPRAHTGQPDSLSCARRRYLLAFQS
jgi:hypothetical protein